MSEVVVVAQGPPSSSGGDAAGEVSMPVLSLATGTSVFQLRGVGVGGAPVGCVASVQDGMRVAAVASAKASKKTGSAVYIWDWGREQPVVRSYPPRISVLLKQPPPGSSFPLLVAGCHNGSVLAWELCSGRLLSSWKAHYRGVSALCLSPDASMIVSGGEDGVVHVWPLVAALRAATAPSTGPAGHSGTTRPLHSWSHHTMPVSGLVSGGHGSGGGGLVVSASLDGSVQLYSLAQGSLLRTFTFASAVSSVVLDPSEMFVYVGCSDGRVMRVLLNVRAASGADATSLGTSARGGRDNTIDGGEGMTTMRGAMHKRFVSALALNASGDVLISASDDGILHFFDAISLQSTRTMTFSSSITNLFITSLRRDLLTSRQRSGPGSAHASSSSGGMATKYASITAPLPPIAPLAKYVHSQPLDLKSWEDTYIYVAQRRRRESYRAYIDDDEEDVDDRMQAFSTSADVLQRFARDAPDDDVSEPGGGTAQEEEVSPAEDSELCEE